MPSLQVRELPEHIYRTLCHEAEAAHRSIAQQAVAALAKGLQLELEPRARRMALLATIQQEAQQTTLPDPALLIREDRER
jgi:plasmid stability protein